MKNYVLARSWARANVQDREYYYMTEDDKDTFAQEEKVTFGDKVYDVLLRLQFLNVPIYIKNTFKINDGTPDMGYYSNNNADKVDTSLIHIFNNYGFNPLEVNE